MSTVADLKTENSVLRLLLHKAVSQGAEAAALATMHHRHVKKLSGLMTEMRKLQSVQTPDRQFAERIICDALRTAAGATIPNYDWPDMTSFPLADLDGE